MKRDEKWVVPRNKTITDPRIAVARHIGWIKSHSQDTQFSLPEPDHYNYAGLALRPIDCPVITDQVFYQDRKTKLWWSLYYVPAEQVKDFVAWAEPIEFIQRWTPFKSSRMRQRRGLLYVKGKVADYNQTDNERLYTMGYYENLKVKYFSDDPEYVDSLLGPARAVLKDYVPEEHSEEVDDF
jgi:hypothetical protein